ncbi:nucleotidyltransferase domain-containing protein [Fusibacter sp. A1]|nr:nucleotidyltransferase domain-containing protein [Fusibacter sp. A1]RXV59238.1 nucleotidyltransferase domain-containing protein [Fusibacter sp. A1]
MIQNLLQTITPDTILLFGSLVNGQVNDDSDIDLLVVWDENSHLSHSKRRQLLRKSIGLVNFPIDIITCTQDELTKAYSDENSFTHAIIDESEVLYGRLNLTN